jgi:(1->4)-alpha-D-glucan 1-alpha-D-glucosylmutase
MKSAGHTIPTSTYRLQLPGHLRFEAARDLVPYLAELGIGAVYASPFLMSRQGSTHGYDVVDHSQLDPAIGTLDEFGQFAERLTEHGMGLVVDIVPNHMGIDDPRNRWWQDVLENGPASTYARYFDIDWNPPKVALQGKVLLPVLGEQFGRVLENQQLRLAYEDQRFVVRYYERSFPTDPVTCIPILKQAVELVAPVLAADVPERMELESIVTALEHLPARGAVTAETAPERYRETEVARRRLSALQEASGEIRAAIDQAIEQYNGRLGEPASFDGLEALLADQAYRLCYWRVATDEINYRRFFDVDSLAAIRVEDPEVFEAVHQTILELVRRRWVTGLRIDHADGLLDPAQYLADLAQAVTRALTSDGESPAGDESHSLYTLVEKILAHDEVLPSDWPIDGTTGYEFLNLVNDLFIDRPGAYALRDVYGRFTRIDDPFGQILYESKRLILTASLSAELTMLSHQLDRLSEHHRWSRDFTRLSLYRALREVVAYFPVYRTYIRAGTGEVSDSDRWRILTAVRIAKRRNPAMSPTFFDFIASLLLLEDPEGLSEQARAERRRWVLKFQQVTGPVTAKGLEDTAFYRFYPLASLNEVGGDPTIPGATLEQFHRRFIERATNWPHCLSTTGTHDTKRGEDVRARLNVLAEVPKQWEACIERWHTLNVSARVELDGAAVPDANEEYLIYQTLVGTWPLEPLDADQHNAYVERIVGYLDKALREAKVHTSWLNPYEEYDQAVAGFIRAILVDRRSPFVKDVEKLVRSIADPGFVNSLAQTLIKICAPGVPDFYQGVEFWDFNLVDPDNRRPVDFAARSEALVEIKSRAQQNLSQLACQLLADWPDRRLKMFLIWRALELRRREIEIFRGAYEPLVVEGPRAATVFAFARGTPSRYALCIVPRLASEAWKVRGGKRSMRFGEQAHPWPVGDFWRETVVALPAEARTRWRHAITGHVVEAISPNGGGPLLDLGEVFRWFPVALLVPDEK